MWKQKSKEMKTDSDTVLTFPKYVARYIFYYDRMSQKRKVIKH